MNYGKKHVIAVAVCAVEALVYACIGAMLGWKGAGGIIPMMILMAVWGATWTGITKADTESATRESDNKDETPGKREAT